MIALLLILLNRVADGVDGAIARRLGSTDLGGYLDILCDFIFYAAVPLGFALARPENGAAAAFLIFSFVGTGSSFLAYAAIAAKRGLESARARAEVDLLSRRPHRGHGDDPVLRRDLPVPGQLRRLGIPVRRALLDHHGLSRRDCLAPADARLTDLLARAFGWLLLAA